MDIIYQNKLIERILAVSLGFFFYLIFFWVSIVRYLVSIFSGVLKLS